MQGELRILPQPATAAVGQPATFLAAADAAADATALPAAAVILAAAVVAVASLWQCGGSVAVLGQVPQTGWHHRRDPGVQGCQLPHRLLSPVAAAAVAACHVRRQSPTVLPG